MWSKHLPALRRLTIGHRPKFSSLFAEGEELISLQELSIYRCPHLKSFPKTGLPSTLRELRIRFCDGLEFLPDLTLLNNLEVLELYHCSYLSSPCKMVQSGQSSQQGRFGLDLSACKPFIARCRSELSIAEIKSWTPFPISGLLRTLRVLNVDNCAKLESLLAEKGMKINCPDLEFISISSCRRLKTLPDVMQNNGLRNLSQLVIRSCDNLESLPEGWFPTTNLTEFDIIRCQKLKPLPNHAYNNNLSSLEKLGLYSSPAATGLVSHILDERNSYYFTNLTSLTIANVDIPIGDGKLCGLQSLRKLNLYDCDWVSFPKDVLPSSLVVLDIWIFPKLKKLSFKDFENLVSLEQLCIKNCPKLKSISELGPLPSLSDLLISDCPKLASFPEQGLPPSLLYLQINGCPKLKQRCEKGKGQYWRFIADVPQVMIDED